MNPIPVDFDLSKLVGESLDQICIGKFQIQLRFKSGTIEGSGNVAFERASRREQLVGEEWESTEGLETIIGSKVEAWEKRGDFEFALSFESGGTLVLKSEESPYEDFTVNIFNEAFWVL